MSEYTSFLDKILNGSILKVKDKEFRICEAELYAYNPQHKDPFTHMSQEQKIPDIWYFHKRGGSYKSGTFKGLDICQPMHEGYGGILIRAIIDLATNELIEGPCNVVDKILSVCKKDSVKDLVESICDAQGTCNIYTTQDLHLEDKILPVLDIYEAPRVGLTLNGANQDEKCDYITRNYRFSTCPERIKKNKFGFALGLLDKKTDDDITKLTGVRKPKLAEYKKKKGVNLKDYYGKKLQTLDICDIYHQKS